MSKAMSNRQRFGYLPHVLSLLLPEIGEEGVVKLVQHFGGTRLYVSHDGAISRLSPVMGNDIAEKIRMVMRENLFLHFDVPVLKDFKVLQRKKKIASAYADGVKVKDIARNLGMTERGVYYALKSLRDDGIEIPRLGNGSELRREQRIAEARSLYSEGWRIAEIAERLSVSQETVIGYLNF